MEGAPPEGCPLIIGQKGATAQMRENKTASKEIRGSSHSCRFLFLPRYLRPIVDLEAHGPMSIVEKLVRLMVFGPIMAVLIIIPTIAGLLFGLSGATIVAAPALMEQYGFSGVILIVLSLISMFYGAFGVRKYFLPFG